MTSPNLRDRILTELDSLPGIALGELLGFLQLLHQKYQPAPPRDPATPNASPNLQLDLAILLYQHWSISLSKAREMAGIPLIEFQKILSARGIDIHSDIESFEREVQRLQVQGHL